MIIMGVKFTFLHYPFSIETQQQFHTISIPDLLRLGATKFYTLGRRGKWKDYVDIYFLLKSYHSLDQISRVAYTLY